MGSLLENIKETKKSFSEAEDEDNIFVPRDLAGRKADLRQKRTDFEIKAAKFYEANKTLIDKLVDEVHVDLREPVKKALHFKVPDTNEVVDEILSQHYKMPISKSEIQKIDSMMNEYSKETYNLNTHVNWIEDLKRNMAVYGIMQLYEYGKKVNGLGPEIANFNTRAEAYYTANKNVIDKLLTHFPSFETILRKTVPGAQSGSDVVVDELLTKYFGTPITQSKLENIRSEIEQLADQVYTLDIDAHWSTGMRGKINILLNLYHYADQVAGLSKRQEHSVAELQSALDELERIVRGLKDNTYKLNLKSATQIRQIVYRIHNFPMTLVKKPK